MDATQDAIQLKGGHRAWPALKTNTPPWRFWRGRSLGCFLQSQGSLVIATGRQLMQEGGLLNLVLGLLIKIMEKPYFLLRFLDHSTTNAYSVRKAERFRRNGKGRLINSIRRFRIPLEVVEWSNKWNGGNGTLFPRSYISTRRSSTNCWYLQKFCASLPRRKDLPIPKNHCEQHGEGEEESGPASHRSTAYYYFSSFPLLYTLYIRGKRNL